MNIKCVALAAFALLCGCAGQQRAYEEPNDLNIVPQAGMTSSGSSAGGQQAAGGPRARTREQVHAEAVQAMKNYQSTLDQERDWFNPFAR